MPIWLTIIIFVLIFAVISFLFRLANKAIRIMVYAIILCFVIFGIFVAVDSNNFRQNFPTEPKLFLLHENNQIMAGLNVAVMEQEPEIIEQELIDSYQSSLDGKDYKAVLGSNYKLFLISSESFDSVPETIIIEEEDKEPEQINKSYVFELLRAGDPISKYSAEKNKQVDAESNAEFKAMLFGILINKAVEENGLFLFYELKQGNIFIYPETAMFKLIKIVPLGLIEKIGVKVNKNGMAF